MEKLKIEGIVLRCFPFKENDQILTLFTEKEGLVKLFVKGSYRQKKSKGNGSTNPLNLVEVVYAQGRGELFPCYEIEIINSHSALRQNLPLLEAACDILQVVLVTQLPGKSAPDLYNLLLHYLKKIPEALQPQVVSTSFRLKTLRYEGILNDHFLSTMNTEEQELIKVLTLCRDFSLFIPLTITPALVDHVKTHFSCCLDIDPLNSSF